MQGCVSSGGMYVQEMCPGGVSGVCVCVCQGGVQGCVCLYGIGCVCVQGVSQVCVCVKWVSRGVCVSRG